MYETSERTWSESMGHWQCAEAQGNAQVRSRECKDSRAKWTWKERGWECNAGLLSIWCGAYKSTHRERCQNVVLVSHNAEHSTSEMWYFVWSVIFETLVRFHNFKMKSHPNPRAQEKCKIASPRSHMYGTSHQGKMVKCCSSSHCPGTTSWSRPTNSSHCCSDR